MDKRVLGVLGGQDLGPELLKIWADSADILLAADSGADRLVEAGFSPDITVGDLDSVSAKGLQQSAEIVKIDDTNLTDCDKLLLIAAERGCRAIVLAAIEGDRLDHLLSTLISAAKSPMDVRLAIRAGIGFILKPGRHSFGSRAGRTVSILPVTPTHGLTSEGLRWPMESATLQALDYHSISNAAIGDEFSVSFREGVALLTLETPVEELPQW